MNILYCTQSDSLELFRAVDAQVRLSVPNGTSGYTIADSWFYSNWVIKNPAFEKDHGNILKEWEVTKGNPCEPDLARLASYEKKLGCQAGLFGALVADRRLIMGRDCSYKQDYSRRFTDNELLNILLTGIEKIENLFEKLKPDVVVGFICVTMIDYLVYLFAKANGVIFLNLRPGRVGNYVYFSPTINDPCPNFSYLNEHPEHIAGGFFQLAKEHIKTVRETHGRYEGVVKASDKPALKVDASKYSKLSGISKALKNYLRYRSSIARDDNHVPNQLVALAHTAFLNPLRAKFCNWFLKSRYLETEKLPDVRYAFFPLHTEPEVSLLVYGRPFVNQIELVRMIALSLPVDMILVVKEHPWMVGKRSLNAYRKLLDIPRVKILKPGVDSRKIIENADLVTVITGSVALEAAILEKPVITFGDCPYNQLPETMVRQCKNLRRLPSFIENFLSEFGSDETALEKYIAATMAHAEKINLYSVLLNKKNVHTTSASSYQDEIDKLASYFLKCIENYDRYDRKENIIW